MKYQGIILSDIHFGAFDVRQLIMELQDVFLPYIENLKEINYLIITGDYFDKKLFMNEEASKWAMWFMQYLVSFAKTRDFPIRIVYGTESHESNQYQIFSHLEQDPLVDFKIIKTVTKEELLPGLQVLYLPEEHIYDKKEYYKDYLTGEETYHYIFGHGVIDEIMSLPKTTTKTKKQASHKTVPRFTTKELLASCKGEVYFGHYHVHASFENRVFYVGSFSRWKFGEEKEKGFFHVSCDLNTEKYKSKFIQNYKSCKYNTYTYKYTDPCLLNEEALYQELKRQEKRKEIEDIDHMKLVFNIPEDQPSPEFMIKVLGDYNKDKEEMKVEVVNGYIEKKKALHKEALDAKQYEYSILFDHSISIEEKIAYYAKQRFGKEITVEKVKSYLGQSHTHEE